MGLWERSSAIPGPGARSPSSPSPEAHHVYTDLLTFCFDGPNQYDQRRPIFIDAQDPSRSLNASQFRLLIIYPALFFAIIGAGGVFMGSNSRSQPQELEHILQLADPKLIITSRDALPNVLSVSAARGMLSSQVCLLDEYAPNHIAQLLLSGPLALIPDNDAVYLNFAQLLSYGENDWVRFNDPAIAKSTPAAMFSTSGTGGLPKGALLSHHAIVSHHLSINYDVPYVVTRLISLPMFHLFGSLWTHIFPIRYGQPLFVLPRFELTQYVAAIYHYQITETYMVPAMIHVFNRSAPPIADYMGTLRYVGVAGAPIDGPSMEQFQRLLHPHARATQLWGMTEVGVVFQTRYGEHGNPGSIGRLLPGYEVRLVGQDGNVVQGESRPGELYVRGAGVLMSYKGRNDAKDAYGWFRTGDVAYVQNGQYFIVGRTKELIKVRGWQVAPAELEAVLLKHPGIEDAAVTGVTSKDGSTELPRAFVVRAKGPAANRLTAEEVYQFARRQLASYKALDGGIVFVEEIPRTASGKIQRFKLSQMNTYRDMVSSLLARFKGAASGLGGLGLVHKGRVAV
ncbi:hypothetical protein CNMCM7927_001985 [Aspergillus lentulus]|nr:hypothetical protein CNMCM7927_001985 [Aspergillus lentulus]